MEPSDRSELSPPESAPAPPPAAAPEVPPTDPGSPAAPDPAATTPPLPDAPAASVAPEPMYVPPWAAPPPQSTPQPPPGFATPPPSPGASYWVQAGMVEAGPAPGVAYAGFGVRAVAYLVDWVLLGIVSAIVWFGAVALGVASVDGRFSSTATAATLTPDQVAAAMTVAMYVYAGLGLAWLITALYFIFMWRSGGTIGMRMLGLRVACEEDGRPIGFGRATARYLGYLVDWLALGLGLLWVGIDDRKQGWHDKIAGTLVVRRV